MPLAGLALEQFRNYASAELALDAGLTIVAGPNGSGKTNLLEAVWVTVTGRSHRSGPDQELVRHGAPLARVRLYVAGPGVEATRVELVIPGVDAPADLRKRLTINGLARRQSSLTDTVRAVLFRPEEMLLLVGSPGERRRFLDGIVAQRTRGAAHDQAELSRILAQRNALLRAIRGEEADPGLLDFWDDQLATVGGRVMAARLHLVDELSERLPPLHGAIAPAEEQGNQVAVGYLDTLKDAWPGRDHRERGPEALSAALRRRIVSARQKEVWHGMSLDRKSVV